MLIGKESLIRWAIPTGLEVNLPRLDPTDPGEEGLKGRRSQ
jgi:hypothetical protein